MNLRDRAWLWLREPLVHFLLLGAMIYAVMAGRPPDAGERRIVVDQAVVARLVERWSLAFRRVPTSEEIDGMIRDHVQDEVYYREALRLGLDRDDDAVRRRMRNKMVALATGEAEAADPTDAQLQALLDRDPARYAIDLTYNFRQVYLGPDSPATVARAQQVLTAARRGIDPVVQSQPTPLPLILRGVASTDVAAQFGETFERNLRQQTVGQWQGPLPSGFGLHLVKLEERSVPAPPRLADVRQRLENDWRAAALKAAEGKAYQELLNAYDVVIDAPK